MRRVRIVVECVAHELHALAHGFWTNDEPRPDTLHELIEGEQIRGGASEREEQLERQLRQGDRDAIAGYTLPPDVDDQIIDPVAGLLLGRC